jgi:hypothetical protein
MAKLWEIYAGGARLEDAIFVHLMDPEARERLRGVPVQINFFLPQKSSRRWPAMALSFWLHSPIVRGGMNLCDELTLFIYARKC